MQVCKNLRFKGVAVPRDYEQRFQRSLWVIKPTNQSCRIGISRGNLFGCKSFLPMPPPASASNQNSRPKLSCPQVFRHQRVYCPRVKAMVHAQPLPQGGIGAADVHIMSAVPPGEEALALDFLGPLLDNDVARGIAEGELNTCRRPSICDDGLAGLL